MSPRIGINLLFAVPGRVGGSEDYAVRVLMAHADHAANPGYEAVLIARTSLARSHPALFERYEAVTIDLPANRVLRVAAEHSWLARQQERLGLALMHHMGGTAPRGRTPAALTVHDLQPLDLPQNFSPVKRRYLARALPASIRRAQVVVGVSEWVRTAVIERFALDPRRAFAVSAPIDPDRRAERETSVAALAALPPALRSIVDTSQPYVIYPAIAYRHKNHTTLLQALARLDGLQLVLCGGAGPLDGEIDAEIAGRGLGGRVVRLGRISRAHLDTLVARASALVFPSCYEGFGLPVVEALQLGCPVVAADTTALPEALGGAGRLVGPLDVAGWARALGEVVAWTPAERAADTRRASARLAALAPPVIAARWQAANEAALA